MKRLLFLLVVAWLPLFCAEQLFPSPALEKLLNVLDVSHGPDLQSVVDATQKRWLQKNKERWEFEKRDEDKKDLLLPIFRELGMIDTVDASCTMYDYALVYGATYGSVVARIEHLVSQYKRGVRFKQVVLLTGQRRLGAYAAEKGAPLSNRNRDDALFMEDNADARSPEIASPGPRRRPRARKEWAIVEANDEGHPCGVAQNKSCAWNMFICFQPTFFRLSRGCCQIRSPEQFYH